MHTVLVVEDDPSARALFAAVVSEKRYACDAVADGGSAIARLRRHSYCAVLLDLLLPVANGFEVLQFIRSERPAMLNHVIVMTCADDTTLEHFDHRGVWTMVRKPIDIGELAALVESCAEQRHHDH